jgi:hypothetical protein
MAAHDPLGVTTYGYGSKISMNRVARSRVWSG